MHYLLLVVTPTNIRILALFFPLFFHKDLNSQYRCHVLFKSIYDWSRTARKMCSRTTRESTVSTPMFASYLQTVEEVTAVLAGRFLLRKLGLLGALHGWNKALSSLDSDGITNQRGRKALGWRQKLHMRFRSTYAVNFMAQNCSWNITVQVRNGGLRLSTVRTQILAIDYSSMRLISSSRMMKCI